MLLRRLRELGELHQAGILTDEEFTTAKQAVLKRQGILLGEDSYSIKKVELLYRHRASG